MSYTEIVKTYSPPIVKGVITFITNDLPIRWSIRVNNGKSIDIHLIDYDESLNLDECHAWVTLKSSSKNYLGTVNNGPIPLNGHSQPLQGNDYDSVEVKIFIKNKSLDEIPFDFKTPEAKHDRVLIIQGEKFYVQSAIGHSSHCNFCQNKYLATCSNYFDRLFNGNFAEKDKGEIEIKDVDEAEFEELLKVIFPTRKIIDHSNVVSLWMLADRFDIPSVAKMCENYMTSIPGFYMLPLWEKYDLAVAVNSEKLKKMCRETKMT